MRTRHTWYKLAKKETTICADACQKIINVAHGGSLSELVYYSEGDGFA
tara:strand:- start:78 stop:221 length:144 start_codon:yes stop_codon:yes gene_type:complete